METNHTEIQTQALLQSLFLCPLLVGNLPEATVFDRNLLGRPPKDATLNYSQKLGHLYEDALTVLLENNADVQLIDKSIQIFDENQITLGELDYLLKEQVSGKHIHLEIAVKFYLIYYQDGSAHFPGPDPRDNWINKLNRMRSHQFQMATSEHGKKLLEEKYGVSEVEAQQLIYGRIFDHIDATRFPQPPYVNADCLRSPWLYEQEWDQHFPDTSEVRIIPKHLWPVDFDNDNKILLETLPLVPIAELKAEAQQRCTLFWSEQHQSPIFLAPNHWPEFK